MSSHDVSGQCNLTDLDSCSECGGIFILFLQLERYIAEQDACCCTFRSQFYCIKI